MDLALSCLTMAPPKLVYEAPGRSEAPGSSADRLASMSLSSTSSGANKTPATFLEEDKFCSACGKTGDGLKSCAACKCVYYCGVSCQKIHRDEHKIDCKRIAKVLKNDDRNENKCIDLAMDQGEEDASGLFDDPPPMPDCSICMVKLPIDPHMAMYQGCCGKEICVGCCYNQSRVFLEREEKERKPPGFYGPPPCAFCREPVTDDVGAQQIGYCGSEGMRRMHERAEKGDANAMWRIAAYHKEGMGGFPIDYSKALDFMKKAADLGHSEAAHFLGESYWFGTSSLGTSIDRAKAIACWEKAAKLGSVLARHQLGCLEHENGNLAKAIKHYRISAAAGYIRSVAYLIECFETGVLRHEDLAQSMRERDRTLLEVNTESRKQHVACVKAAGIYEGDFGVY